MNRITSSSAKITIDNNGLESISAEKFKEIKKFKNGLQSNERVQVLASGNSVTYTKYIESRSEKLSRKLNDFSQNAKSTLSSVRDSFATKNKVGTSHKNVEATANINDPQTTNKADSKKVSMSAKSFNMKFRSLEDKVPVLERLQGKQIKIDLGILKSAIESDSGPAIINTLPKLGGGSQKLENEIRAFSEFINAQANGITLNSGGKEAIDFANRWMTSIEDNTLKQKLSSNIKPEQCFETICIAALALLAFNRTQ